MLQKCNVSYIQNFVEIKNQIFDALVTYVNAAGVTRLQVALLFSSVPCDNI